MQEAIKCMRQAHRIVLTANDFDSALKLRNVEVRFLILPNLELYSQLLEPELLLEKQNNEMKRHEAWLVYGALQRAACLCVNDRLNTVLLRPPKQSRWKSNGKVMIIFPSQRKASMDNLMQQPSLKKMATLSPTGVMPVSSMAVHMHRPVGGFPTFAGAPSVGVS